MIEPRRRTKDGILIPKAGRMLVLPPDPDEQAKIDLPAIWKISANLDRLKESLQNTDSLTRKRADARAQGDFATLQNKDLL
jgi:hypothetical protein